MDNSEDVIFYGVDEFEQESDPFSDSVDPFSDEDEANQESQTRELELAKLFEEIKKKNRTKEERPTRQLLRQNSQNFLDAIITTSQAQERPNLKKRGRPKKLSKDTQPDPKKPKRSTEDQPQNK